MEIKGFNVVNFDEVDPVLGLEDWLNLVASCDSVVSVANTTIHGSGGLNVPTLCLLSRFADWRWLQSHDFNRSYWYPSVGIARIKQEMVGLTLNLRFKLDCQWLSPTTVLSLFIMLYLYLAY